MKFLKRKLSYLMSILLIFNLLVGFIPAKLVYAMENESEIFRTNSVIAGGNGFSLVLGSGGTVYGSGKNQFGQLGGGAIATPIPDFSEVISLAAGTDHAISLKSDGTVWAWGKNGSGQVGDGSITTRTSPVQVLGLTEIIAIAANGDQSMALKSDGTVWAWGKNDKGQLGDGTITNRTTPIQVSNLTNVIAIAAGNQHSMAIKSDGTVWTWGANGSGRLGDGTTVDKVTPVQVSGLTDAVAVSGGKEHSLALKSDGTVWAWGNNGNGRLGDGTTTNRVTPIQVSSLSQVTKITTWADHSLALKSDGTVWAWGNNGNGRLGDGTTTNRTTPVQVSTLTSINAIATGNDQSLAVKEDGTVWAWGSNSSGQLADGTTTNRPAPVLSGFVIVQKSANANLTNISTSSGDFDQPFNKSVDEYSISVNNSITTIDITPTLEDNKATMKINDDLQVSGVAKTVNLNIGENVVKISILAEDGVTQKTYTLKINRATLDDSEPEEPQEPETPKEPETPQEPEVVEEVQEPEVIKEMHQWEEIDNQYLHSTNTLIVNNKVILVNKNSGVSNVKILDANGEWKTKLSGIPEVKAMSRVPGSEIIYLIGSKDSSRAFYISRDGGENWSNLLNEGKRLPDGIGTNNIDTIWVQDENTLYLTVDKKGIYKSNDGGVSWNELNGNLPAILKSGVNEYKIRNVWSINGKLYAGLKEKGGIYISTDGGNNWTALKGNSGLTDGGKEPRDLAVVGNKIYMASKDGVWFTNLESNDSWTRIGGTTDNKEVARLQYVNNVLYAIVKEGVSSNIYYYEEGIFKPFTNRPQSLTNVDDFFDVDYNNGYFYVAHKKGLLKIAEDWDINQWNNISGALAGEEVRGLTILNEGNRYIAGTKSGKIFVLDKETRLLNGWQLKATGSGEIRFIGQAPNSDIVYAFGKSSFYISNDRGVTWEKSQHSLPDNSVNVESALLISKDEIFIVLADKGVYHTTNGGQSWKLISGGLPLKDNKVKAKVIYMHNSKLYLGMGEKQGVYVLTNDGLTWESFKLQQGLTELGREVKSFYSEGDTLYLGSKDGVWKISESMDRWQRISGEIPYEYDVISIVRKESSIFAIAKKSSDFNIYEAKDSEQTFKVVGTKPDNFITSDAYIAGREGNFFIIGTKTGVNRVKLISSSTPSDKEEPLPNDETDVEIPNSEDIPISDNYDLSEYDIDLSFDLIDDVSDLLKEISKVPNDTLQILESIQDSDVKTIYVDVSDEKVVEGIVFDELKGKDKKIIFEVKDNNGNIIYSWTFDGATINSNKETLNFTINFESSNKDKIIELAKTEDVHFISFVNHGELPGKALIRIKVDETWLVDKDNSKLYLYYYNPDTLKLEAIARDLIVEDGYVEFELDHNSDYILVDGEINIDIPQDEDSDTPSNGGSDTPSNGGSETPQDGGSETPSNGGSDTPSNGGGDTPSNGGGDTPSNGGSDTPSNGGSDTPQDGGSETPSNGGSETPSNGGSDTPSNGGSETPSNGGSETPSNGGSDTPSNGGNDTPSNGESDTPSNEESLKDKSGSVESLVNTGAVYGTGILVLFGLGLIIVGSMMTINKKRVN